MRDDQYSGIDDYYSLLVKKASGYSLLLKPDLVLKVFSKEEVLDNIPISELEKFLEEKKEN